MEQFFRWFLDLDMTGAAFDHSTFSKNQLRRCLSRARRDTACRAERARPAPVVDRREDDAAPRLRDQPSEARSHRQDAIRVHARLGHGHGHAHGHGSRPFFNGLLSGARYGPHFRFLSCNATFSLSEFATASSCSHRNAKFPSRVSLRTFQKCTARWHTL
jgi:hypothetical protein